MQEGSIEIGIERKHGNQHAKEAWKSACKERKHRNQYAKRAWTSTSN